MLLRTTASTCVVLRLKECFALASAVSRNKAFTVQWSVANTILTSPNAGETELYVVATARVIWRCA